MSTDLISRAGSAVVNSAHFPGFNHPKGPSLNTVPKVIMSLLLIIAIDSIAAFPEALWLLRDFFTLRVEESFILGSGGEEESYPDQWPSERLLS